MQVLLEDIARTLGATKVTLPGSPEDTTASAVPPAPYNPTQRQDLRAMSDQLPVDLGRLNLGLDESGLSRMGGGRGFRDVPSPYRAGPPMLTQPRGLERQLA
jgi:hypothetical protein